MNILLLWGEAMAKGYAAPIWMTFKQALELDAHVRKGEHGSLVVYANSMTRTETDENGADVERAIPFMKGYTVFNVEQVEGLPAHYYARPENPLPLSERIGNAERFMTNTAAAIQHGGNQALYAPARDVVQLPPFEAFRDKESYYATALHELTHWTSHKSRLDRCFNAKRFGDHGYAREELVAELGSDRLKRLKEMLREDRRKGDHANRKVCDFGHEGRAVQERQHDLGLLGDQRRLRRICRTPHEEKRREQREDPRSG